MILGRALCGLVLAPIAVWAQLQQSIPLAIVPSAAWTDTGVLISNGETFSISASGTLDHATGDCPKNEDCNTSPNGVPWNDCESLAPPPFSAPGLPCWSLIGRIGETGTPFEVGTSLEIGNYPPGELFLGVNDNVFPDNTGLWIATITSAGNPLQATPGINIDATAVTVAPGATTGNTSIITLAPRGGFAGSVTLTAAVTSSPSATSNPPMVSFASAGPVSISGTSFGTATLTISTTTPTSGCSSAYLRNKEAPWYTAGSSFLAWVLLFTIPKQRSWRKVLGMLALLITMAGGVLACGGAGKSSCGPSTSAGAYTVTVTGTSGATSGTGTVAVTVE